MLTLVSGRCLSVQRHPKEQSEHSLTAWGFLSKSLHILYFPPSWDPRRTILVQHCLRCVSWCLALKVSPLWICEIVRGLQTQLVHVQGSSDCSSSLDKVDRQFLSRCSLDTSLVKSFTSVRLFCGSLWIFHSLQFFTLFSGLVKFILTTTDKLLSSE